MSVGLPISTGKTWSSGCQTARPIQERIDSIVNHSFPGLEPQPPPHQSGFHTKSYSPPQSGDPAQNAPAPVNENIKVAENKFNPEPTAKGSGASGPMRGPTVPAETDASARSPFAVGAGLNDSDSAACGMVRVLVAGNGAALPNHAPLSSVMSVLLNRTSISVVTPRFVVGW